MSEDLIRKIAGLLATAESFQEQGNEEAAASYIAKAHQLQTKYNIDQDMIEARNGGKTADKIISILVKMPGTFGRRRIHLAHYIATATDCTGYFGTSHPFTVYIGEDGKEHRRYDYNAPKVYYYKVFGFSRDAEWVATLCERLNTHLSVAMVIASKDRPSWEHHKTWGSVFVEHYARAINTRLLQAKREARKEAEAADQDRRAAAYAEHGEAAITGDTSVALVLADKAKQVQAEYKARVGGGGRTSRTSSGHSSSAASAGKAAGNSASLGRSVGGGSKGSLGK